MRILLWSDLHAHEWPALSHLTNEGINSRLQHALDVITALDKVCVEENIKSRIFLGDLFHVRGQISVIVLTKLLDAFSRSNAHGIEDYLLVGNHDLALNTNFHSLTAFSGIRNLTVVDAPCVLPIEGTKISFHPWRENRLQWREEYLEIAQHKPVASMMHFDFCDVQYRGQQIGEGCSSSVLNPSIFSFSGHYHDHKNYDSLVYVGSPMQHNWSDVGTKRGYIILTIESKDVKWEFHSIKVSPRFHIVKDYPTAKYKRKIMKGGFVRVVSSTTLPDKEKEQYTRLLKDSAVVQFVHNRGAQAAIEQEDIVKNVGYKLDDVIETYVKSRNCEGLTETRLIKIGKELIS